jgi:formylglycine-generating enzyme
MSSGGATATGGQTEVEMGGMENGGEGGAGGDSATESPNSCASMDGTECHGTDCCESLVVPGGKMTYEGSEYNKYEVTVARFREYMLVAKNWEAAGNPQEGAGAHPDVPNSGWKKAWLGQLEELNEAEGLSRSFDIQGIIPQWWDYNGAGWDPDTGPMLLNIDSIPNYPIEGTDQLAVNAVPFIAAYAFCIWDGGRLPTLLEWLYAYHNGEDESPYPWGASPTAADLFEEIPAGTVPFPFSVDKEIWDEIAIPVGSHPASVGKFGHHDLQEGLRELVRDSFVKRENSSLKEPHSGLIELRGDEVAGGVLFLPPAILPRTVVGNSWAYPLGSVDGSYFEGQSWPIVGFRCARD